MSCATIPVSVELSAELEALVDAWKPIATQLPWRIESALTTLCSTLGIPGQPTVEVHTSTEVETLNLFVHGVKCRYSPLLVGNIAAYVAHGVTNAHSMTFDWAKRVARLRVPAAADLLVQLITEVVKQQPDVLLGDAQVDAYLHGASATEAQSNSGSLALRRAKEILCALLKLKLSIADSNAIVSHIVGGDGQARSDVEISEALAAYLCPNRIVIAINRAYAQALFEIELPDEQPVSVCHASRVSEAICNYFRMLADGMFYELGIRVCDIALVASDNLKPRAFAFKLNHVTGVPYYGIEQDELLVNDAADQLKLLLVLDPIPTVNPANGNAASLVKAKYKETVESHGLTTWDAVGYLVLALARELRSCAGLFVNAEVVEYELAMLHQAYPELVNAAVEKLTVPRLTRVLRTLLSEGISIRHLKAILERLITVDYVIADMTEYILFDDRLGFHTEPSANWYDDEYALAQHVRAGLKRYISDKYTKSQSSLIVYLVDPRIEGILLEHLAYTRGDAEKRPLTTKMVERILAAVREEASSLPFSTSQPVILTSSEVRHLLRSIIAPEHPLLAVVSYEELTPETNIQPITRISLLNQP